MIDKIEFMILENMKAIMLERCGRCYIPFLEQYLMIDKDGENIFVE